MSIFIDSETGKRVNIYAPFKGRSRLTTPEIRAEVGVVEIADDVPPADYDPLIYTVQEDWNAAQRPYTIYTRKPDAQIKVEHNDRVQQTISGMEQSVLLPRATREFMLTFMELQATQAGMTPEQLAAANPGYRKIKEFDAQMTALRATLHPVDPAMRAILDARIVL